MVGLISVVMFFTTQAEHSDKTDQPCASLVGKKRTLQSDLDQSDTRDNKVCHNDMMVFMGKCNDGRHMWQHVLLGAWLVVCLPCCMNSCVAVSGWLYG